MKHDQLYQIDWISSGLTCPIQIIQGAKTLNQTMSLYEEGTLRYTLEDDCIRAEFRVFLEEHDAATAVRQTKVGALDFISRVDHHFDLLERDEPDQVIWVSLTRLYSTFFVGNPPRINIPEAYPLCHAFRYMAQDPLQRPMEIGITDRVRYKDINHKTWELESPKKFQSENNKTIRSSHISHDSNKYCGGPIDLTLERFWRNSSV